MLLRFLTISIFITSNVYEGGGIIQQRIENVTPNPKSVSIAQDEDFNQGMDRIIDIIAQKTGKPVSEVAAASNAVLAKEQVPNKIVGGSEAEKGELPWQVSFAQESQQGEKEVTVFCGGSLVAPQWVLSAAHCVPGFAEGLIVIVGDHDRGILEPEEQRFKIQKYFEHERYSTETLLHDLALVLLEGVVKLTAHAKIINLPMNAKEPSGYALVSGWGHTSSGGESPPALNRVRVPIIPIHLCQFFYLVTHSQLCAGFYHGGKDSCQGDSGGPLVCYRQNFPTERANSDPTSKDFGTDPYQCGVVSYGKGCALPQLPGVYARVGFYLDWITKKITQTCLADKRLDHVFSRANHIDPYQYIGTVGHRNASEEVRCVGVLIHRSFVLTSSTCCQDPSGKHNRFLCVQVDFDRTKSMEGTENHFTVSGSFTYNQNTVFSKIALSTKVDVPKTNGNNKPDNSVLVLRLYGIPQENFMYPAQLAKTDNFVGAQATLVSLKKDSSSEKQTRVGQLMGEYRVTDCPKELFDPAHTKLNSDDVVCAIYESGLKCNEAAEGSALICKSKDLDQPDSSFLCGLKTSLGDKESTKTMDRYSSVLPPSWQHIAGNVCLFRKISIPEFASESGSIALPDLMEFRGIRLPTTSPIV